MFNGIGVDGVGVNFLCFCVSLSYLHFVCVFAFLFFCFSPFSLFLVLFFLALLCFPIFVSFYSFREILVFSAHFQAVAVDCLSVFGLRGNCKNPPNKKGISL